MKAIFTSIYLVAVLIMVGCGGASNNSVGVGVVGSGQEGRAAKLMLSHRVTFTPATYAEVKRRHLPQLLAAGYTFSDATSSMTGPSEPIRGRIVKIGSLVTGTNSEGIVKIPKVASLPSTATVLNELSDTKGWDFNPAAMGSLDAPSTITINIETDGELLVTRMDSAIPPHPERSTLLAQAEIDRLQDGCKTKPGKVPADSLKADLVRLGASNEGRCTGPCGTICGPANTCCEIADGFIPYHEKPCDKLNAVIAFQGSTCFRWWQRGVCAPPGTGVAGDEGICYFTHRGRWCQEIKEGAAEKVVTRASTPGQSFKIANGESIDFTVTNETRRNTVLVWYVNASPNVGTLSSSTTVGNGSGQLIELKFWDDVPDGCQFLWQKERQFRFTANLPDGMERAKITIQVSGYPGIENFDVDICR